MATIDSTPRPIGTKTQSVIDVFGRYVVPNYKRFPVCLVRGEGSRVWDAEGNEYLDLFPGWGCNLLGHCPGPVVRAVQEQVARLIHVPNTWYTEPQGEWARLLSERSFGGQAFFCNSGTEANEAAIKLVRLRSGGERYKIITFQGGFHGRTMVPDVITLAKSLCAGIAGGAMLTSADLARHLRPGMHAATFGGNPVAAAAGIAAIRMIEDEGLLEHVDRAAAAFRERLATLKERCDAVCDVRVMGMMIGVELTIDGAAVVQACLERNLLVNCTQGRVIRLLPAMTITPADVEEGCDTLAEAIIEVASRG
ncbi:MAG: aminotransferase class III-fold pyridoxal phosphate-dependent enzyme [Planctomycetia bacterium]|nr:aminotransferase class III-fold pyridoxal phosphate-dependent enzyme [Planctomycetia bacterium]